ncbi:PREDICTED: formin-like protein 3 [Nipponia nippon]|uniref:formin-like protein 3 n=1 Tax=Nipponia nippon TaxID=128390 RepID=UPI0005119052|nr:PREDICTED: formin-like protein 3 [Nipponia nippon]
MGKLALRGAWRLQRCATASSRRSGDSEFRQAGPALPAETAAGSRPPGRRRDRGLPRRDSSPSPGTSDRDGAATVSVSLSSMNLPPDKARLLRQYDNEKKWDLICDQVGDWGGDGGWVREFLNDENKGLDVLVNYLSFAQCAVIYGTLPSRRALKNSRLVSQKDDVHLCIMCLRAIMNYQYGFNLVMSHPHAVNEIALSLNNKNPRTKALVLELLAAVCLVRGGHEIILAAFDNFKEVRGERSWLGWRGDRTRLGWGHWGHWGHRDQAGIRDWDPGNDRTGTPTRTRLGPRPCPQKSRHTESEKLQVQIQAYLDNVFDVGGLLEDAETKNVALEKVEELEEHLSHLTEKLLDLENENMMRVAELEKQLLQREKELEAVKETYEHTSHQVHTLRRMIKEKDEAFRRRYGKCPPAPPLPGASPSIALTVGLSAIRIKKPIKTKDLDLERFEELFKTKAQGPALDLVCAKNKASQKAASKVTLLEANRAKNLAITLRKAGRSTEEICRAIHTFDLATLPVDFVECLMRGGEKKPLEELADEDRFMLQFSKVERLPQRMAIMAFLGNFAENLQMLTPQLNAIIAASASVKSSQKLKHMLEIILALGNYMNSSKRGAVYGFKLQSLDLLLDTKSTDRKMTLLHFIALTVREKYPELATFWQELHFVEKAAAVSLENVLLDVKELGRGMELLRRECGLHENSVLRTFLAASEGKLERLQKDARTAEDAYNTVVRYFGESPKTTPPSVFFPVFVRFIRSYKPAGGSACSRARVQGGVSVLPPAPRRDVPCHRPHLGSQVVSPSP